MTMISVQQKMDQIKDGFNSTPIKTNYSSTLSMIANTGSSRKAVKISNYHI